MSTPPIPEGYHTLTPYLTVHDTPAAIDYYRRAFGATELRRMSHPDGKIIHAEVQIGDAKLMLADEFEEWGNAGPRTLGGASGSLMLYVEDVDSVFARALKEGGRQVMAVEDQFYGDRSGILEDPFGHIWTVATQKEALSEDEISRRAEQWFEEHMP